MYVRDPSIKLSMYSAVAELNTLYRSAQVTYTGDVCAITPRLHRSRWLTKLKYAGPPTLAAIHESVAIFSEALKVNRRAPVGI
jgi:hypothetical protein